MRSEKEARADYEANVARRPWYHDGAPRRTWEQLNSVAKWSWMRTRTFMIGNPNSEAYKIAVELERTLRLQGKEEMNKVWAAYVEKCKAEGRPLRVWEQGAIADTVRGLQAKALTRPKNSGRFAASRGDYYEKEAK